MNFYNSPIDFYCVPPPGLVQCHIQDQLQFNNFIVTFPAFPTERHSIPSSAIIERKKNQDIISKHSLVPASKEIPDSSEALKATKQKVIQIGKFTNSVKSIDVNKKNRVLFLVINIFLLQRSPMGFM